MYDTQHIIAFGYGIYDYADGVSVVYLVDILAVAVHLLIYAVVGFYPSVDMGQGIELLPFEPVAYFGLYLVDKVLPVAAAELHLHFDILVREGVEVEER